MKTITQLESLGYRFALNGETIQYTHPGPPPNPTLVRPLLADLKRHKVAAIRFLQNRVDLPLSTVVESGEDSARYPITIDWPEDTPIEMVGDYYTVDLFTGRIRAIYHTRSELAAAVYGIAMCKEAMALGGVVSIVDQTG